MSYCYHCFQEHNAPGPCPRCGYDPAADAGKFPQALPHGTILAGQFITGRVLGQGGFGITYLALDNRGGDRVALKEFLPDTMAGRSGGSLQVTAYSGDRGQQFQYGLDCFLDEARTLAKFLGNPNIVGVRSYFQENGTAYFTMDYIEGVSLKALLRERGGRIGWEESVRLLLPVMNALEAVHRENLVHRDVTPDNIYISRDGQVKLLDFGAARYSLGDRSRSLDVVLKPGYAPKEQYVRRGRQGPYTDVYSLGACFYAAMTGYLPPEALERWDKDEIVLPSARGVRLPPALEDVLLRAMEVDAGDRYQTMTGFREALLASLPAVEADPVPEPVPVPPEPEPVPVPEPRVQPEPAPIPQPKPVPPPEKKPDTPDTKKKWYPLLGAAAVAAVLLAVIGIAMGGRAPASPAVPDLPDKAENMQPQDEPVESEDVLPVISPDVPELEEPDESEDVLPVIFPDVPEPEEPAGPDPQYPLDGTEFVYEDFVVKGHRNMDIDIEPAFEFELFGANIKLDIFYSIVGYVGSGGEVTIPSQIGNYRIASMEMGSLTNSGITSLMVESDCHIGYFGFDDMVVDDYYLTSVEFAPSSESERGHVFGGFSKCRALTDVIIGSNHTIDFLGFSRCPSLARVTIGSNCIIYDRAFHSCTSLTSLTIGSGCEIERGAFGGCTSLASVTLPDDCTYYADSFPDTCVVTGGILME